MIARWPSLKIYSRKGSFPRKWYEEANAPHLFALMYVAKVTVISVLTQILLLNHLTICIYKHPQFK